MGGRERKIIESIFSAEKLFIGFNWFPPPSSIILPEFLSLANMLPTVIPSLEPM